MVRFCDRWLIEMVVTAAAEIGGRLVLSQGLASSFRPRKYYTVPKETVEAVLEDLEQLVDFLLLEFQRILFAENVVHTVAVCLDSNLLLKYPLKDGLNADGNCRLSLLPLLPTG